MRPFGTLLALATLVWPVLAGADPVVSEAEQRLFLDPHLSNAQGATTLRYRYAKTGTLEETYEDQVRVTLTPSSSAVAGRHAHVDYLSGARALTLPDLEAALGNPVILFFLERDVREMQRLTGGQAAYFRKRVRLALADAAQVRPISLDLAGGSVEGVEILVRPYEQDTMRARFPRFADKTYRFILSPQVPGMVVELQSAIAAPGGSGSAPLMQERLVYAGAEP